MKRIHPFKLVALAVMLILSGSTFAQKGKQHHPHQRHHGNKVIAKRSVYRPHKVIVYHPAWRPQHAYNRRWVYFPTYNVYWDNWRNHYVFFNGTIWLSQPAAPAIIVGKNLEKEKHEELKEDTDDVDDIYKDNNQHKEEIKPD